MMGSGVVGRRDDMQRHYKCVRERYKYMGNYFPDIDESAIKWGFRFFIIGVLSTIWGVVYGGYELVCFVMRHWQW